MEDLFSGIIPIIIIIVIINVVRSAIKKKKPAENAEGEPQAPRPPVMSDIQKAFMLMNDFDDKPQQTSRPNDVRREGSVSNEGTRGRSEGLASNEGMRGRTEGLASHEGSSVRTQKVSAMKAAYSSKLSATYGEDAPQNQENKYANVKIDKYTLHDEDEQSFENMRRREPINLKLFDNKNEFVKAVIYSEILTRKTARR